MKRGQIYILAVVIIAFLIYTLVTPANLVHQVVIDDDFEQISQNYRIESAKLLNALINKQDANLGLVNSAFLNFTVSFTSYSKTKNPNFGLIYAFPVRGFVFVGNYADVDIKLKSGAYEKEIDGCFSEVSTSIALYGISLNVPDINPSLYKECIDIAPYPSNSIINFTIQEIDYMFALNGNRSDIIIVSRENLEDDVKVYISENNEV